MSPGLPTLGPLPPLAETLRRSFVELLGTFALALMAGGPEADAGTLEVAFASGLGIAVMITAVGHLSGGYFNPAITFGFMLTRRISVLLGLVYVGAPFGGGSFAGVALGWC